MEGFQNEVHLVVQQMCDQIASADQTFEIVSSEKQYYQTLYEFNQSVQNSVGKNNNGTKENYISDFSQSTVSAFKLVVHSKEKKNIEFSIDTEINKTPKPLIETSVFNSPVSSPKTNSCHDAINTVSSLTTLSSNKSNNTTDSSAISIAENSCIDQIKPKNDIKMTVQDSDCAEIVCNSAESLFPPINNKNYFDNNENSSTVNSLPKTFCLETVFPKLVAESSDFGTGNFLKGCKWAPDGLCFLSNADDNYVKIFNTPYECLIDKIQDIELPLQLGACLMIKEPGTVYDYCWWPLMNSNEPVTCCFATTSSDHPVHLWDAFNGKLRATYIALNSVQELTSPYSLCFSNDGQQLLCGFKKDICLYYTDRPGAHYERWSTMKKKQRLSQNNIISCMEFCQDDTMFACGSYDGTVGLYSPANGHLLDFTAAHSAGVTWLKFSRDGYRMYTGARKENLLKCWDIRNLTQPVSCMMRHVSTNQRIYFDIIHDGPGQFDLAVVSGSTDGNVSFYNIAEVIQKINEAEFYDWKIQDLEPKYQFKAHNDCVNGCSFHPFLPLLLTASGQRNYPDLCEDDDCGILTHKTKSGENKVKMWYLTNTRPPLVESN